jgi:hypothetical protein
MLNTAKIRVLQQNSSMLVKVEASRRLIIIIKYNFNRLILRLKL